MRIGLAVRLIGGPRFGRPMPTWETLREQALLAEEVGFDLVVVEDALSYPSEDGESGGLWESVCVVVALAEATTGVDLGHSVLNAPYRSPAHVAKIAGTLDEISGGRYVLGIGAGNTPDADYAAFGFPADHRYSRFAEGIEIIHGLLKHGEVDFEGEFQSARNAEMEPRGPRPQGPPIVVAAGGPKMMRAAARFADEWNWWVEPRTTVDDVRPMLDELERACEEVGRDPESLGRSLEVYLPVAAADGDAEATGDEGIAAGLLAFEEVGIGEVRCYLPQPETHEETLAAILDLAGVVERVHAG